MGLDETTKRDIRHWFGSMYVSTLSLYKAVTSGDDWGDIYDVAVKAGPFYGLVFLLFTFFFLFALFNILTGILVEKAVDAGAPDRKDLIIAQRKKAHHEAAEFRHLCKILDAGKTGNICWSDFQEMMNNEVFVAYMASVGLEVNDVELFFHSIAEKADQNTVTIDQFVHGCMHMKGAASSIDMQKSLFEQHLLHSAMITFQQEARGRITHIEDMVGRILASSKVLITETANETRIKINRIEDMVGKMLANSQRVLEKPTSVDIEQVRIHWRERL